MQGALIFSFFIVLPAVFSITNARVYDTNPPTSSVNDGEHVYIVYLSEELPKGQDPESYYIRILSSVVGSQKAAKNALVYSYGIIPGFAARLNPDQATILSKKDGVSYVVRDITFQLDDGSING